MSNRIPPSYRSATVIVASAVMGAAITGGAAAQTCATPLPLSTGGPNHVNTCATTNSLPYFGGVLPSPHNDAVFSFVSVPGMSGTIDIQADFAAAVVLIPSPCGPDTLPDQAALTPASIGLGGLSPGTYFLVVTGDPDLMLPVCGSATVTPNAVYDDTIFINGFE